ncbi:hypothetical protein N9L68_01390 [bacterium]|nr:hypothetical protein [bacterium]
MCPYTFITYTQRGRVLGQAEDESISLEDSFEKMLVNFGHQCGERSSSIIGNREEPLVLMDKQGESGDDEDEEEEEEEQEESEEEEEEEITPAPAQMTAANMKKQLQDGSISQTQYDINIKRIKKRADIENEKNQAAQIPVEKAQEKAKAAVSLLRRLITKANHVKMNTKRTKLNKSVMLAIAENIKEVEATRNVLMRLSDLKKAHLSYTYIIHTYHTHVSYTRIIHTYHTHASYTRIAKNFHAQVSNTHTMNMHHLRSCKCIFIYVHSFR